MSGRNVSKEPAGETSDESFLWTVHGNERLRMGRKYIHIERTTQYLCTAYSF